MSTTHLGSFGADVVPFPHKADICPICKRATRLFIYGVCERCVAAATAPTDTTEENTDEHD